MAKQSEQIKKDNFKMIIQFKKNYTFAPTVPVMLLVRSAHGSFFLDNNFNNDNTPPMPLYEAHLGGFLFL